MGGQKVSPYQRQQQGYNTGYSSFDPNVSDEAYLQRLGPSNSNLNQGAMKGWQDARAAYNNRSEGGGFVFEMPDFSSMYNQTNYAEIQAQQQAEAERRAALAQISDLYSRKFDAAEKATADINQQIADEMGHAQVVGLDYNIDDVTKQSRINNLFATYWGEGDDSTLTALTGQWGDAGYKWDLPIVRGTPAEKPGEKTPGDKAGAAVKAKAPKLKAEEDPLGSAAKLA